MDADSSPGAAEQPKTSKTKVRSKVMSSLLRLQLQPEREPKISRCSLQNEWCLGFGELTELMCPHTGSMPPLHLRDQPQKHENCSPGGEAATHLSKADQVLDAAADQERCACIRPVVISSMRRVLVGPTTISPAQTCIECLSRCYQHSMPAEVRCRLQGQPWRS